MTGSLSTLMGPGFFMFFQQEVIVLANDDPPSGISQRDDEKDIFEMLSIIFATGLFNQ